MAGNFWQSSHYQEWVLDKQELTSNRQADLQVITEDEYQKVMIFFANFIQVLGEQLKLRQQVIATATVYLKRFYSHNSLRCVDPLLLAPTCVFLASKVEEFGVISNSRLINTCQTVVKNKLAYAYAAEFPYRNNHILECEFYLLENLDCCLVVYQPYRSRSKRGAGSWFRSAVPWYEKARCPAAVRVRGGRRRKSPRVVRSPLARESTFVAKRAAMTVGSPRTIAPCAAVTAATRPLLQYTQDLNADDNTVSVAWRLINDSLRTEVCLLYPPYMIALACLHMACVILNKDNKQWFAELHVNLEKVMEISRHLLALYQLWRGYDEKKEIQALLQKMPKPKTQPSRPPSSAQKDLNGQSKDLGVGGKHG